MVNLGLVFDKEDEFVQPEKRKKSHSFDLVNRCFELECVDCVLGIRLVDAPTTSVPNQEIDFIPTFGECAGNLVDRVV